MSGADEQRRRFEEKAKRHMLPIDQGAYGYSNLQTELAWQFWQAAEPTSADLEEIARKITNASRHTRADGIVSELHAEVVLQILRESLI